MALEHVKLQGAPSVSNTESSPKASTNSFNTSFGNLFIKEQTFYAPQKDTKTVYSFFPSVSYILIKNFKSTEFTESQELLI